MNLIVDTQKLTANIGAKSYRVAIGSGGAVDAALKREGDKKTPLGTFPVREVWYRADRRARPITDLPVHVIAETDGWCDDANLPEYNTHVTLPFSGSHEKLWREDEIYNLVLVIGHNDAPVVPGLGSAVFVHIARPSYTGTEGCIALAEKDLEEILACLTKESMIEIV